MHTTPASHSARFERVNDSTFVILADDIVKSPADTCRAWLSFLVSSNLLPHVCKEGECSVPEYWLIQARRLALNKIARLDTAAYCTTSAPPPHWWRRLKQTSNILDQLTGFHSPWRASTTPFILTLTCSDTMGFAKWRALLRTKRSTLVHVPMVCGACKSSNVRFNTISPSQRYSSFG